MFLDTHGKKLMPTNTANILEVRVWHAFTNISRREGQPGHLTGNDGISSFGIGRFHSNNDCSCGVPGDFRASWSVYRSHRKELRSAIVEPARVMSASLSLSQPRPRPPLHLDAVSGSTIWSACARGLYLVHFEHVCLLFDSLFDCLSIKCYNFGPQCQKKN